MGDPITQEPGGRLTVESLLGCLALENLGAADGREVFWGPSEPVSSGRVFGGQVLAQSVVAATRTVDGDRQIHSTHGYFLRAGDARKPITFTVESLGDGHSFSRRRVQAHQDSTPIFSMIGSFHVGEGDDEYQPKMPADLPDPDSLPSLLEAAIVHPELNPFLSEHSAFDIRRIEGPDATAPVMTWMRATAPVPDDPPVHRAALAYASDYGILDPILTRHRLESMRAELKIASLDHALWWHRDARVDEWLLHVARSPAAQGSRGLGAGHFFRPDGALVATVVQEGMIRGVST